jgi:superfamily II DNA or RNA helicase
MEIEKPDLRKQLLELESMHTNLLPYFFKKEKMTEQLFSEMRDKYLGIVILLRGVTGNDQENIGYSTVEYPGRSRITINEFIPQLLCDTSEFAPTTTCAGKLNYASIDQSMKDDKKQVDERITEFNRKADCVIRINNFVTKKLLSFQLQHVKSMIYLLQNQKKKAIVDLSDTGTGKTYCALAVAKSCGMIPIIVAPKSALSVWERVLKIFHIKARFLTNYESMIKCKGYSGTGERVYCPFIKAEKVRAEKRLSRRERRAGKMPGMKTTTIFEWQNFEEVLGDRNVLLIFDEAHKCKNRSTCNSQLLRETTKTPENVKILMLSATISQSSEDFAVFGECLGLYKHEKMRQWFRTRNIPLTKQPPCSRDPESRFKSTLEIHKAIFPNHAVRMRICNLGDAFPENHIIAEPYNVGSLEASKIDNEYHEIDLALADLRMQQLSGHGEDNPLVRILRARQRIELNKVDTMIEIIQSEIDKGNFVPVFVNFQKTVDILCERFKTTCCFTGKNVNERDDCVKEFMSGNSKLIICNIRAGGTSISLHDTSSDGSFPRVSVISPAWSAIDTIIDGIEKEIKKIDESDLDEN